MFQERKKKSKITEQSTEFINSRKGTLSRARLDPMAFKCEQNPPNTSVVRRSATRNDARHVKHVLFIMRSFILAPWKYSFVYRIRRDCLRTHKNRLWRRQTRKIKRSLGRSLTAYIMVQDPIVRCQHVVLLHSRNVWSFVLFLFALCNQNFLKALKEGSLTPILKCTFLIYIIG